MSILFVPLEAGEGVVAGSVDAVFSRFTIYATDVSNTLFADFALSTTISGNDPTLTISLPFSVYATGDSDTAFVNMPVLGTAFSVFALPEVYALNALMPAFSVVLAGYTTVIATLSLDMRPFTTFATPLDNVVIADMPAIVAKHIGDDPVIENAVVIAMSPGYMLIEIGTADTLEATSSGIVRDTLATDLSVLAFDRGAIAAVPFAQLTGSNTAHDLVLGSAAISVVELLIAEATAAATDSPDVFLNMLLEATDVVLAAASGATLLQAIAYIATQVAIHDQPQTVVDALAADAMTGSDQALFGRVVLLGAALDALAATDNATNTIRMLAVASSDGILADTPGTALTGLAAAFDEGLVAATVRINGDTFAVYAMTYSGAAVSEYENYNFNSFCRIDRRLYGASDRGTFLLEGADDAGTHIDASVAVGFTALGTQLKKTVPNTYVGLKTNGEMLFKTSTTDQGIVRTRVYKLNPVRKDVVSDNRFSSAKGIPSVYWGFELANYEGSDFELETIKVWRLTQNRRK